ncbi:calcium-binding protein [Crocosphaera sp.]|uniref:calcium-binding protein n=1 Tax=Crocosphaera sp. TaxID=2729996 RepID=UPI003F26FD4B|nr:calcium-binding protein [Crocosphaera sp.]
MYTQFPILGPIPASIAGIFGTPGNDTLIGTLSGDFIDGLAGNDFIDGLAGNDTLFGGQGDDILIGGRGDDILIGGLLSSSTISDNDLLIGGDGNDIFYGGDGNDTIFGGLDNDTASYVNFNGAIIFNLDNINTISKIDSISRTVTGVDEFSGIETIIGNNSFKKENSVNGSTLNSSLNVDLLSNSLQIFGSSPASFNIINFSNVIGTNNSDTIFGDQQDNYFIGSNGNDNINGRLGLDTIDYQNLSQGISVQANGMVNKGILGNDQLTNIENIIGTSFDDQIIGNHFDNSIIGGAGNDFIDGVAGDDTLIGGDGFDVLFGGNGADTLTGVDPNSLQPGFGEVDILQGDDLSSPSADLFVLGDQNKVYYLNPNPSNPGNQDYALILDFQTGIDQVQLKGSPGNYTFTFSPTLSSVDINYVSGSTSDLIGIVNTPFNPAIDTIYV